MKNQPQILTTLAGEPAMPFNEVNIKFKDKQNGISFRYGLTVKLTQDDLPYTPETKSSENLAFCGLCRYGDYRFDTYESR